MKGRSVFKLTAVLNAASKDFDGIPDLDKSNRSDEHLLPRWFPRAATECRRPLCRHPVDHPIGRGSLCPFHSPSQVLTRRAAQGRLGPRSSASGTATSSASQPIHLWPERSSEDGILVRPQPSVEYN